MCALAGRIPRHPQPKGIRVTFSVQKTRADANLKPFPWIDEDGIEQYLPDIRSLTGDQALLLDTLGPREVLLEVAPDVANKILKLELFVIEALFEAWRNAADDTVGEGKSPPSSRSSTSTARTSKPTSKGSTAKRTRSR